MDAAVEQLPNQAKGEQREPARGSGAIFGPQGSREHKREGDPVVRIVYTTLSPTFQGPVAGYTTLTGPDLGPTPLREVEHAMETPSADAGLALPTVIHASSAIQDIGPSLLQAAPQPTLTPSSSSSKVVATPTSVSSVAQASETHKGPAPGSDAARGNSAGLKAGIAFGVVGGLMVLALVGFLFWHRRKEARREQLDDEKFNKSSRAAGEAPDDKDAPRISLRPVTQFFPTLNIEKNAGNGLDTGLTPGIALTTDPQDRSESANSSNPFGFYAERIPTPIHEEDEERDEHARSTSPRDLTSDKHATPENPSKANHIVSSGSAIGDRTSKRVSSLEYVASGSASTRKTSMMSLNPNQIDLTMPPGQQVPLNFAIDGDSSDLRSQAPSPSMGAAAIEAAGGPANSTVHRVQLSFKPTLTDELEIHAGDLIRLLHEYDDGWALVIRLDRSQQGVVPRTCLSAYPVKPRAPMDRPLDEGEDSTPLDISSGHPTSPSDEMPSAAEARLSPGQAF